MAYIFTLIVIAIILGLVVGGINHLASKTFLKTEKSKKSFYFISTITACVLISVIGDILQATIFK